MVDNILKRRPGRPLAFDPDAALDAAILVFFQNGYAGADTQTLAAAMGVTKPSIYGTFGSKEDLFLKALHRYADVYGGGAMAALIAAPDISSGVHAFFDVALANMTQSVGPQGCLISCVASQCAPTMPKVAAFIHATFQATDDALTEQFQAAIDKGFLPKNFPAKPRAKLMYDLVQGLSLRARAGFSKADLTASAKVAVAAILA